MLDLSFKTLSWIGAAGVAVSTLAGGFTYLDSQYAKATDMKLVQLRLEEKILTDREAVIQQRIWSIEDRYDDFLKVAPAAVKEEHRQMVMDLEKIKQEISSVMDMYHEKGYPATDSYYKYERAVRQK